MFHRLVIEDSSVLYTIAAFLVASSIFVGFAWRALHMSRSQLELLSRLPFDTATPASTHERRPERTAD
jgi:hypothetical protein